ncbi:hypothetical protein EII14_02010 [Alloprevotella sp. OH1205_COT-284]|uniref:F0F1 ATP synthase subunit epsilon n=1 Tax=Alloprevotella sp. OH1205_COT-284 TaxID=2491043 RepID=UPI000F601F15|nr:F0F1 ATP synthase subunit epsilon [Alloprevotella sp. OH1205_COT-284]RRD80416.1 hypothetical protein EII14_02010 [Alloprevotella sp. OH1205_COT-284]
MPKPEKLHVVIVSVERTLYDGLVERLFVPGEKGRFEVLKNHASIISTLIPGSVVCEGENAFEISISGGFVEVKDNEVTLCVETL